MPNARPHINLPVSNLDASIDFYNKVFGVEPTKVKEDYANYRLNEPSLHLALVYQPGVTPKQVANGEGQHFGIELFEEQALEAWKARVKSTGLLPHLEEEGVTCCYAVANKFWLHDPDGNEWEFWVRHDDEGDSLYSSTEASSCCAPKAIDESKTESCCG